MMKKIVFLLFLLMNCFFGFAQNDINRSPTHIIPEPVSMKVDEGYFQLNAFTKIFFTDDRAEDIAGMMAGALNTPTGYRLSAKKSDAKNERGNVIILSINNTQDSILGNEGYSLKVTSKKIIVTANHPGGLFYSMQTLMQLLPPDVESHTVVKSAKWKIPAIHVIDYPRYGWRGMHLDVSRHFFSVGYLKKFIDRMAMYKLNRFHLHLTDDQGWRIQIKKYPQLTEEGAWRTFDSNDSACMELAKENPDFIIDSSHIIHRDGKTLYGGFYTQDQMREVIKYAGERKIEIIPELDMPGHMMAAIRIFPYLSCTGQPGHGEIFSVPLCPCEETTYEFAQTVYKEIFDLFPSRYVHVGGDEVDKTTWGKSSGCKAFMQKEGIKNVNELQSYFIKRMEKFFQANGKKLIGWDEILEGGIDSSAIIMYWRGWVPNAPVEAANNGNKVIMAPGNPLYFDQFPDKSSLYNVYHFNPVPKGLSMAAAKNIIGIQACLWTERIPSEKRADYMTMPRMTAMAEVAWSDTSRKYSSYVDRLKSQYHRWDLMHIHYRIPDLTGFTDNNVFIDSAVLSVQKPLPNLVIHYSTDGSLPTGHSDVLSDHFKIDHSLNIKLAAYTPGGNRGDIYNLKYAKEKYAPSVTASAALQNGLKCVYYKGSFQNTKDISSATPSDTFIVPDIEVPSNAHAPTFGLQYRGYIDVPETGIYSFYLTSDDGSVLSIDDKIVVDNDGLHSAIERSGEVALEKGLHHFSLDFIEGGGGYTLRLLYGLQDAPPQKIPSSVFKMKE